MARRPAPAAVLEAAILDSLAQRLESALDLTAAANAPQNLPAIAALCREAETLAQAGAILTARA